jgi:hypothetical protein
MTRLTRLLRLLALYELETDPLRRHWCGLRIMRIGAPDGLDPNL